MHIKPADRDAATASQSGRQLKEPTSMRKVRLGGGAARVPSKKETTESPLRVFVSAIGQSIGARTPLRKQSASTFTAKNDAASCSTPASIRRMTNNATASSQTPVKQSTSARVTTTASTPRRSSLSSSSNSSSSISSSTPVKKQSPSVISSQTPVSKRPASSTFGSTARSSNNPTTPVARKGTSMPPRTPTAGARTQNNPTTPVSKYPSTPTRVKMQGVHSTPISKQATTPSIQRKQVNPTTPIAKQPSVPPTTPVNGYNNPRTPLSSHGSNIPFYTPTTQPGKSSLPGPLQPRDANVPSESSRRLHFGINLSAMAEQENMGLCTPRACSSTTADATYSFDKNRLAQIKARRNAFQKLLTSPAQRVRLSDSTQLALTPRRPELGGENSDLGADQGSAGHAITLSPTRRRVANSLF